MRGCDRDMTGHTDNEIIVDAPIDFVWAATNDVRDWPNLFTEYESIEVLDEQGDTVTFRLTMKPDENGNAWSWVSRRTHDKSTHSVRAQRVETGFFEYMHLRWHFQPLDGNRTLMRWSQDFTMKAAAPIDDAGMQERLNRNTVVQQQAVKDAVEARRHQVVDMANVPANRRRGAALYTMLSPPRVGATAGFSGVVLLAPGEVITEHYHPYSEEFIHVVAGELQTEIAGEITTVFAGQAVFVPKDVPHRILNTSRAPVRVVFFLSPLAPSPELGHVDTETLGEWQARTRTASVVT